jgi:glutamate-ammonia-ligase adenylyltransferase
VRRLARVGQADGAESAGLPVLYAAGSTRLCDFLASIANSPAGKALNKLVAAEPGLARILGGIAETAPYLWDLVRADPARVRRLISRDPDEQFAAILARIRQTAGAARAAATLMGALRRAKAEAMLLVALADIGGVWPVERVTRALTEFADAAVGASVRYLLRDALRRGQLAPSDRGDPETGSGYIVLAMGKMGAYELNFSSDIDLIVFYDPSAAALPSEVEPALFYVRLTRDLVKLIQERAPDYVFRVDLRLRPDPSSTQIAISSDAALDYYESRGQNWERAALIKARPCAGDRAAGERLLDELSPFVWRKYLDYATVADVHEMKRQIHAYRGYGEIAVEGHNIKLGRGGIREIEFFVQTQQLIAGGRHNELRGRATVATLAALAAGGWIDNAARDELTAAYEFLRRVEHRLQMLADEQTHTLPADAAALSAFARFLGFAGRDEFAGALVTHLRAVERHYVKLFEREPAFLARRQNLTFSTSDHESETLDALAALGFRRPQAVVDAVRRWREPLYPALRGEQARNTLAELVPPIIDQVARSDNPDLAFVSFDQFLSGLRAGGRFLSLLRQNPEVIEFVALILGVAPRLADTIARNPHLIDPLIDPSFFGALPDAERLAEELSEALADARGYEEFLDAIRLFGQERMFLIGARILSGSISAEQAGEVFARLAEVLVRALLAKVQETFAAAHGRIRSAQTAIIALGRLGAQEMTASSDLDLIVVYDFDQQFPASDGERPLYGAQYFARLTQRLISALTAQTSHGLLYPVDMRLRPSGRSGPLAAQIDGFANYQDHEAWTWEHMALTRARVIAGPPDFCARIQGIIRGVLCRERNAAEVAADVVEMRGAIAKEKGDADRWDLKHAAGALVDIEFIAQYLQLVHAANMPEILDIATARTLEKAERLGVLPPEEAAVLRPAVKMFHDLTQIIRLCLAGKFDPAAASDGVLSLLARAADLPDFPALQAHVQETQRQVRECFVRILGSAPWSSAAEAPERAGSDSTMSVK